VPPSPGSPSTDATTPDGATDIVDNTPPQTQEGDLLVAIIAIETGPDSITNASAGTISTPTGWTALSQNVSTSGNDLQVALYWKIADAADAAGGGGNTYTWNFSDTYRAAAQMEHFTQVGATPFESGGATCTATLASTTITAPSLTTGKASDLNVCVWVTASHQLPNPSNSAYAGGLEPGTAPTGQGPFPDFATLVIPDTGTATGNQTATTSAAADNIGCQFNLSPLP
jgi:hypothetical protein